MNQKKLSYSSIARKVLLPFVAIMTVVLVALWSGKTAEAANINPGKFFAPGGSVTYSLDNPSYVISENLSWVSITRNSATRFTINIAENRSLEDRSGYVYVKNGSKVVKTYQIEQYGDFITGCQDLPVVVSSSASTSVTYLVVGLQENLKVTSSNNNWVHISIDNLHRTPVYAANGKLMGYKTKVTIQVDRNTTRRDRHANITFSYTSGRQVYAYTLYQSRYSSL